MNKELENNEWKELAPTLAEHKKFHGFDTPSNYFDGLDSRIHNSIFLDELKSKNQHFGFTVPEEYFENLNLNINTTLKLDEVIDPMSASFTVPDQYFAKFQKNIEAKTSKTFTKTNKRPLKLWTTLTKYAVAASLLIVSSIGIYRYNQNSNNRTSARTTNDIASDQFLHDIDESTIIQNIDAEKPAQVVNVSAKDADMETYLINHYTVNELAQDL